MWLWTSFVTRAGESEFVSATEDSTVTRSFPQIGEAMASSLVESRTTTVEMNETGLETRQAF